MVDYKHKVRFNIVCSYQLLHLQSIVSFNYIKVVGPRDA